MSISGLGIGAIATGSVFVYAGLKGKSIPATMQAIIQGKSPTGVASSNTITGTATSSGSPYARYVGGNPPNSATVAGYKAYATMLLAAHGWANQMPAFNNIVMAESGWNPNAKNPTSGAYGIAQALGHGNANTRAPDGENNYGGYGTSDAVCKAANEGHGNAQIEWMMNYIASAYGSPNAAWAYHQANNSY